MNAIEFRQLITHKIKAGENITFIKAGDGEQQCISGKPGKNCDGHNYSSQLGIELLNTYAYFCSSNAIVSQFPYIEPYLPTPANHELFESMLLMESNIEQWFISMYSAIRNTTRQKQFIGNGEVYSKIAPLLKIDSFIEIEKENAYFKTFPLDQIMKKVSRNDIVLVSGGFLGKILAKHIHEVFKGEVTILDTGSAFDPLISNTRSGQVSKGRAEEIFKQICE